uniref:Uncharacterized protein n=1 Tax=Cryptococcus bacillisporus CA1280 TaxID=1296109 RepID=A0A0D0TM13_CRYGA|nr:hypothetical protein I312_02829 [Cryptococcus bacillisporus CA1280]
MSRFCTVVSVVQMSPLYLVNGDLSRTSALRFVATRLLVRSWGLAVPPRTALRLVISSVLGPSRTPVVNANGAKKARKTTVLPKPSHSTTPTTVAPTARALLPEVVLPSTGEDLLSLLSPFLQILSPTLLHPCFVVVSLSTAPSPALKLVPSASASVSLVSAVSVTWLSFLLRPWALR